MYIDLYIYTLICVHFSFLVMCLCCSPLFGSNRAFSSGITKHLGSSAQVFWEGVSNRLRSRWHRAHGDNRTRRVPEDGPPFRVLFFSPYKIRRRVGGDPKEPAVDGPDGSIHDLLADEIVVKWGPMAISSLELLNRIVDFQ